MSVLFGLALAFAAVPARAYMSINCNVDVKVDARVAEIEVDQQVGAERLHCRRDETSGEAEVHVVRVVKTKVDARAQASARAGGRASGSYSDSCFSYCTEGGGVCHTSGSGSGSCSDSADGSGSSSRERETTFTVARAGARRLAGMGYQISGEGAKCGLSDPEGGALDLLRAIAIVSYSYGEELLARGGADLAGLKRSRQPSKSAVPFDPSPKRAAPAFDGRRP